MAAIFVVFGLVVATLFLVIGAVPDPWKMMGLIRRDDGPRRFYFVVWGYVFFGAIISLMAWGANDGAKNATTNGPQPDAVSNN